jgi:5-formyltetrahydrofolate cyclo-ligase
VHDPLQSRIARGPVDARDRGDARAGLRALRASIDPAARAAADRAIRARLQTLVAAVSPGTLAGYWPMGDEPDLREALGAWHRAGIVVALPRVVAPAAPLEFGRWRPDSRLARGPFGTLHPEPHEPLSPDLLVLPCLGFDARCHRLGYGGGYYDRTLATLPLARAIGVAYDDCEVVGFEPQSFDLALERVVTERREILGAPAR